jgi:hypothetical protein
MVPSMMLSGKGLRGRARRGVFVLNSVQFAIDAFERQQFVMGTLLRHDTAIEHDALVGMAKDFLARVVREPSVHFLLLGAALFAAYSVLHRTGDADVHEILVSRGELSHLAQGFDALAGA